LVKDIGDREFADGNDKPIRRIRTGELILIRLHFLGFAAKIDGLAQKGALNAGVGHGRADFERGAARKTGNSLGVAETKALIEFRIDPELSVLPQFGPDEIHEIKALTALIGRKSLRAEIR